MRTPPDLFEIVNGPRGIRMGIKACLKQQCLVSGVGLIFAGMDAMAALTRPKKALDATTDDFMRWVDRYVLPHLDGGITSADLYAARCGILHTYSPRSRMWREHAARQLFYEWGNGPKADAADPLPDDAVVVRVESLHEAFVRGLKEFLADVERDEPGTRNVGHHLKALLCYLPWPPTD